MPSENPPPRKVLGDDALAALAVPVRFALLDHLLAAGPRTASQCAEVVGESASNCSWHLRALAKAGLVERAPSAGDGRTRPWRATAVGFDFSGDAGPAGTLARTVLAGISARHGDARYARHLDARERLPEDWREASGANEYALAVTPAELRVLTDAVDDLLRPYVRPVRAGAPADARVVHVTLRAFPDPDAS